jgi:phosphohistidine phosphatase
VKLYLCRHGEALPDGPDPQRPLSEKGRADVEKVAARLYHDDVHVGRVLHSGLLRARETAELLASRIAPGSRLEVLPGLGATDPPEPVAAAARDFPDDTLVVGHQPFLGKLASCLTGREVASFSTGSIACLERGEDGSFSLAGVIRPDAA